MRTGLRLLVGTLVLLEASAAYAQLQPQSPNYGEIKTFEFEVRRWRNSLDSEMRVSTDTVRGTDLDPVTDLGLPQERAWDFRGGIRLLKRLKARGSWFRLRYDSDQTVSSDVQIGSLFVPAGDTVTSFLELESIRAGAEFDILSGRYVVLAVIGEYSSFRTNRTFQSGGREQSPGRDDLNLPIFGLKFRVYLTPALAVSVEAAGMNLSQGVTTDFDGYVTYNAVPNIGFSYGYRNFYNRIKDVEPEERSLYRLRGQWFGVTVRF